MDHQSQDLPILLSNRDLSAKCAPNAAVLNSGIRKLPVCMRIVQRTLKYHVGYGTRYHDDYSIFSDDARVCVVLGLRHCCSLLFCCRGCAGCALVVVKLGYDTCACTV